MYENPYRENNSLWIGDNYSNIGGYPQRTYPKGFYSENTQSQNQFKPTPQTINNVLQVMGPESAEAYQVGPNSHVILMDSNRPVFYVKKSDDSGFSKTRAFQFEEIPLSPEQAPKNNLDIDMSKYVTKEELSDFKTMIEDLVMKNDG